MRLQIGRYDAWVTISGLDLSATINGYGVRARLTAAEAMGLLQLLYANRQMLYQALHRDQPYMQYPCPVCQTFCCLEQTATGYSGGCAQCGNDFDVDMAGALVRNHYGRV